MDILVHDFVAVQLESGGSNSIRTLVSELTADEVAQLQKNIEFILAADKTTKVPEL